MRSILQIAIEYLTVLFGLVILGFLIMASTKLGGLMKSSNFWLAILLIFIAAFLTINIITDFTYFIPPEGHLSHRAN